VAVGLAATVEPEKLAVRLDVTGIPAAGATVTINRVSPSGSSAGVRGAVGAPVSGLTTYVVRDWEVPLATTVTYTATVYDSGGASLGAASVTVTVPYAECDAWIVDLARPTNSLVLTVESLAELDYAIPVGLHEVLNRRDPVATPLPARTPSAELVVLTDTLDERDQVRALLGSAYPFLVRTAPDQGIGNLYLVPTEFVEERFLTLGVRPERRFRVDVVQVVRPDPSIYVPLAPNTYANVKATYATYTALRAGVASYDALAYTFPVGVANPILPWPPDDV